MSAKELRQKYTRNFVGMQKHSRIAAWLITFGFFVQIVAAVLAGHFLLGLEISVWTLSGVVMLVVFLGTRLRALNNIVHECSHATFSAHRADNAVIGKVCATFLFTSFEDYRDEHLSHHAHLGDYDHDMDLQGIEGLGLHDPLTPRVLFRHMFNPFLGRHLPYYLGINTSDRDGRLYLASKVLILASISIVAFTNPVTTLVMIIIPFVFVYSALNYWADCIDHAGIVAAEDDLDSSRNVVVPGYIRWLFFPRNDCYHLVHHLFPHIPARHLGATHNALKSDQMYGSRANAVSNPVQPIAQFPELSTAAE